MTSTTLSERDQAVVDAYEHKLLAGTTMHYAEQSLASGDRMNARGPMSARSYGLILESLGRFGRDSDWSAFVAAQVAHSVNLYGTDYQAAASIAAALGTVIRDGYFDVVGATGPEAGRRSAHQHPTTLRRAILLEMLNEELSFSLYLGSLPGIGWALRALIEREQVGIPAHLFPNLVKAEEKRQAQIVEDEAKAVAAAAWREAHKH